MASDDATKRLGDSSKGVEASPVRRRESVEASGGLLEGALDAGTRLVDPVSPCLDAPTGLHDSPAGSVERATGFVEALPK